MVTLFCVAMAAPTAGTHPLKALPVCFRFLSEFEPLRQITGGIRSIIHNGVQ